MNIRKLSILLLCIIYVSTNQLGIHAFAMHGESIKNDISLQENCEHHSNNSNTQENSKHNKSSMDCLTQGKNALSSYNTNTIDFSFIARDTQVTNFFFTEKGLFDYYYYSIHDPGFGIHGSFSKFLDDMYGKGIVMID